MILVKQLHEALSWTCMLLLRALACTLYDLYTKRGIEEKRLAWKSRLSQEHSLVCSIGVLGFCITHSYLKAITECKILNSSFKVSSIQGVSFFTMNLLPFLWKIWNTPCHGKSWRKTTVLLTVLSNSYAVKWLWKEIVSSSVKMKMSHLPKQYFYPLVHKQDSRYPIHPFPAASRLIQVCIQFQETQHA